MTLTTGSRPRCQKLRKVGTQADYDEEHNDLHTMDRRRKDWQMTFNIDQCNWPSYRENENNQTSYQLGVTEVPTATQEKNLGVIITEHMKVIEQYGKVAKTANKVLGTY